MKTYQFKKYLITSKHPMTTLPAAPRSRSRYETATRICADCLGRAPLVWGHINPTTGDWIPRPEPYYRALALGSGDFASYDGKCDVCDVTAHVAVVEFIRTADCPACRSLVLIPAVPVHHTGTLRCRCGHSFPYSR